MSKPRIASLFLAPLLLLLAAAADGPSGPRYTADGALVPPPDYREWVFMSAGLDMSYNEAPSTMGHSMFDNVFVEPAAWAGFKRTGHWPDKTMLVLEVRGASSKGSIIKKGQFQTTDLMGVEVHVRDEARFKGGWGFFVLNGDTPATLLPSAAECSLRSSASS